MRIAAIVVICGVLAGCDPLPRPPGGPAACPAPGYQSLIGKPLAAVTLPADLDLRIIQPGDAVTRDFRPERLNVVVDAKGVIARVYCG